MSGSLFDDEAAQFTVVVNREGQHSLWPESVEIPDGWVTIFGPALRQQCLDYVERSWVDMRPESLIKTMGR